MTWQLIETAPKDGTIIDVWLGDLTNQSDIAFYCGEGNGRRSTSWKWIGDKFRPALGLDIIPIFVQPTHWMPIPAGPE